MNERMFNEINDTLSEVSGDIIDFRVYKGTTFAHLVKLAGLHNRIAVGMDTGYGLEAPSREDYNEHNQLSYPKGYARGSMYMVHQSVKKVCGDNAPYELYTGELNTVLANIPERKYALAIIDLLQYRPTVTAIQYIYKKMAPGGLLYFLNYDKNSKCLSSKAVNEFLSEHDTDIVVHPAIFYNDNRLNVCRVSCKTPTDKVIPPPVTAAPRKKSRSKTVPKHNIALVLKTGGDTYDHRYVNTLAANIRKNVSLKFNLAVLTDNSDGLNPNLVDEIIPLKHNYHGWWSKIELFRPDIFTGRVFYMDLDTVVVNNIDEMVKFNSMFAGIRDLYHHTFLQTGVMSWDSAHNHQLYEDFVPRSKMIMAQYREGDAKWIRENLYNYDYLPDEFPGRIVSYKAHCLNKSTGDVKIPKDASIVCFHGKPRPHTVTHPTITAHWHYG